MGYIAGRLILLLPTAAGMVVVTFCLLLLIPGDPAAVLLGPEASPAAIAELRQTLGLDEPWHVRLVHYVVRLLHGDMGRSLFQSQPVASVILERLGATIELALAALVLASTIG